MRSTVAVGVLVTMMTLAACGGSSHAGGTTTSSTATAAVTGPTTTAPRTTTTPPKSGPDQAIATRVSLIAGDLPSGWTATPFSTNADTEASTAAFDSCIGVALDANRTSGVDSDSFSDTADTISTEVHLVTSRAVAQADFAALKSGKLSSCSHDYVANALTATGSQAGVSIESVGVTPITPAPVGDLTTGVRVSVVTASSQSDVTFTVDLVCLGAGRIETTLSFVGVGAAIDPALEASVVKAVGNRLVTEAAYT
jgi:hypothetical protein